KTFRSAYFALDITDPANPPKLLWEFTDPDLAFTMSYPAVAKVGDNWYVIVGSGPTAYDGTSNQNAKIFVLDLKTGQKLSTNATFNLAEANAFMADPITVDVDLLIKDVGDSYATDVAYIGETYNNGNWKGKLFRVSLKDDPTPAKWSVSTLYETDNGQPITTPPAIAMDNDKKNLWVYLGTGRFLKPDDKTDTNIQGLYGIKEPCWNGSVFSNTCTTTIIKSTLYPSSNVVVYKGGEVLDNDNGAANNFNNLISYITTNKKGWYINLSTSITGGERVLSKPVIFGGIVLFTTFAPTSNICSYGGDGYLYALYYETGTAYMQSVIGTVTEAGKEVVLKKISLGPGIPSQVGLHIGTKETLGGGGGALGGLDVSCGGPANSSGLKVTAFVQGSSGQITQQTIGPAINTNSRVITWREKEK
ncbi:MAG: hypothetical protein HY999_05530, partial [Nitrospinae bacterium]|nr:hypothetical protein [Nitrospinota bacterium]